jgi:tetratricopeptide (TPR) repeat protein
MSTLNNEKYESIKRIVQDILLFREDGLEFELNQKYEELFETCEKYLQSKDKHPFFLETIGDFKDDLKEKANCYEKALEMAEDLNVVKYSIEFSLGETYIDLGNRPKGEKLIISAMEGAKRFGDKDDYREYKNYLEHLD